MRPGTYTFVIKGVTPTETDVTQAEVETTVTWTLTDPCLTPTVNLPAITSTFGYTVGQAEQTYTLPSATVSVTGFCTLEYLYVPDSVDDEVS